MLPSGLWTTCPSPPSPPPSPSLLSLQSICQLIPYALIFSTSCHRTSPCPSHAISPSTTTPPPSSPLSYLQNLKTVRFRISLKVSFHVHHTHFRIPRPFKSPPPPTPLSWTPPPPIPFPYDIPISEDPPPKYDLVRTLDPVNHLSIKASTSSIMPYMPTTPWAPTPHPLSPQQRTLKRKRPMMSLTGIPPSPHHHTPPHKATKHIHQCNGSAVSTPAKIGS